MKKYLMLIACLCVAACGFRPLYQGTDTFSGGTSVLDRISIDEKTGGASGLMLENALIDRFYNNGYPENTPYVLNVSIVENYRNIVIQKNSTTTRAQLVERAVYELKNKETNEVVDSGTIRAVSSYNILSSQYTTLVTQNQAREMAIKELADKLTMRMAVVLEKK